ncbi:MAG: phasin family protein, partial [Betaproteobacteria bacterium]|nr:phasin family protein [Betaproteobacteria bacterium]
MVRKLKQLAKEKEDGGQIADVIRESAEKIWLAGLGAFAKARMEPGKAFETLVREGLSLQSKTRAMAGERLGDVGGKVNQVKSQIGQRAAESWDRLEQVFEDRVARALDRLGVPATKDVQALMQRVDELTAALEALGGKLPQAGRGAPARKAAARKPAARKTAAGKAPARKPATRSAQPPSAAAKAPRPAARRSRATA